MLKNAYLLANIGADTAENGRNVAKILIKHFDKISLQEPLLGAARGAAPGAAARRPGTRGA